MWGAIGVGAGLEGSVGIWGAMGRIGHLGIGGGERDLDLGAAVMAGRGYFFTYINCIILTGNT